MSNTDVEEMQVYKGLIEARKTANLHLSALEELVVQERSIVKAIDDEIVGMLSKTLKVVR